VTEQNQLQSVEYFNYLMPGIHMKINPRFPLQKRHSTSRLSRQKTGPKFSEKTNKMLHLQHGSVWF
jgi:hypothetical protein